MRSFASLLIVLGFAAFAACGDDHGHKDPLPECEEIAEACHDLDTGSGVPHDCHETAEAATSAAECLAIRDACLAACVTTVDGGMPDAVSMPDGN